MAKSEAEKKQPSPSERESVSSQERLRLFMECAKDYAIVMLDPDGRVTEWDGGAEGVFGYPEQEAVGQPFTLFFPPEEKDRPQDDSARRRPTADLRTSAGTSARTERASGPTASPRPCATRRKIWSGS